MRVFLIVFLIFINMCACIGQRKTEQDERINSNCLEVIERKINRYADSLNFWSAERVLPSFVFDPKFDQTHFFGSDCIQDRNTFSHRKAILDRVCNVDVLQAIIDSKNPMVDSLYILTPEQALKNNGYFVDFSYATYSTRYLAERRLSRIREIKKMLSEEK